MATEDARLESNAESTGIGKLDLDRFRQLISSVQAGDQQAAATLVRDYESLIRREVRCRLEDPRFPWRAW
jgi:hypothetical protein